MRSSFSHTVSRALAATRELDNEARMMAIGVNYEAAARLHAATRDFERAAEEYDAAMASARELISGKVSR